MLSHYINRLQKRMGDCARQKTYHMPWSIVLNPTELAASLALLENQTKTTKTQTRRIAIGDKVTLFDVKEKEVIILTLTNSRDSAPEKGFISCLSPLGRELLGRIAGDVIEIKIFFRTEMFRVVRIEEN
ncbi:GreA/GreB family elongation factor [Cellvibrio sp. NN19]|uniref:GreA/GreB family elongation factor n=1 Tax=Cellvibrio chitinivorans TaxID=3102792 RepID=UPI002B4063D0|nr:GreA/GreB family elongation factor [Cellvibrio sp. NN19]